MSPLRVVWLLDSDDPAGAARMAIRRAALLRGRATSTLVVQRRARRRPPTGTPLARSVRLDSLAGRAAVAAADTVVTTSPRTLAWTANHPAGGRTRLVHFVHHDLAEMYADEWFMHHVASADRVCLPVTADPDDFVAATGCPADAVRRHEDFASRRRLLAAPGQRVFLTVGRLVPSSGTVDLVRGFAQVADSLPGWQLRVCGWGPERAEINEIVTAGMLDSRVQLFGATHDIRSQYLEAGAVIRLSSRDTEGLSLHEARSAGVPVITTTSTATSARVDHGVDGLVVDRTDADTVASALLRMADDRVRGSLAEAALHRQVDAPAGEPEALMECLDGREKRGRSVMTGWWNRQMAQGGAPRAVDQTSSDSPADRPVRPGELVVLNDLDHVVTASLTPRQCRVENLQAVLGVLDSAGVNAFLTPDSAVPGSTVGIPPGQRRQALEALTQLAGPGMHLHEVYQDISSQPTVELSRSRIKSLPSTCIAVRVGRLWTTPNQTLQYDLTYGTQVEFWTPSPDLQDHLVTPRRGASITEVHQDEMVPALAPWEGADWPSVRPFATPVLDEINFPIDAVYTWVDGDDPVWRERFEAAKARAEGREYHPEAQAANRFRTVDELRYSLRSLAMYAPWIRRVFLVTDGQTPSWLDTSNPRITVLDHRDVFTDPSVLPVFNSSAIISQLHHIPDLAEHYLYLNDDVFFGQDARPSHFWLAGGIAKVFPSRRVRPFGQPGPQAAPHLNITRNIRAALIDSLGVNVSLAIRHTPYPQIRSVNAEIEDRFPQLRDTAGQQFRSHTDIAQDQLFHYYAQATGRAVASSISYDYANVGRADSLPRLRRLLASRSRMVFCLNDAPEPGVEQLPPEAISAFLRDYFPISSEFEKE